MSRNKKHVAAEIDLLVTKGDTIALVEVKYRQRKEAAHYAISPQQRARQEREARALQQRYPQAKLRFDCVLVYTDWPFVEHIKGAWETSPLSTSSYIG